VNGSTSRATTTISFLVNINNIEDDFIYAARTLLHGDGTLAPLAVKLSIPELRNKVTAAKGNMSILTSGAH